MRTTYLLAGLCATGTLLAQGPSIADNSWIENTNVVWRTGTPHPVTTRWYYPSNGDHPDYSNGIGVSGTTWIYRILFESWQDIGDATTAPNGDQYRLTGYECLQRVSPATANNATCLIGFPAFMLTSATVTPASGANATASALPDLTNILYETAEQTTTVTIGGTQSSGTYALGLTLQDAQGNAITFDTHAEDLAMCLKYFAGSERDVAATATVPSQGNCQGAYDGFIYGPVDSANPPAQQLPMRAAGFLGYDPATMTVTNPPQASYIDTDSSPHMNLLLDNPTFTFIGDFGSMFQVVTGLEGTGPGKHYPDFSTNATTTGIGKNVYAAQFANGIAFSVLNLSGSRFDQAIQLPFALGANPAKQLTVELFPGDPLFALLTGLSVTLDTNGAGSLPPVPLPGAPNPSYAGLVWTEEIVLWTLDFTMTDDRWDTTGSSSMFIR